MYNFVFGTIFGIVVSTIGFTGIFGMLDKGVEKTKEFVQQSR